MVCCGGRMWGDKKVCRLLADVEASWREQEGVWATVAPAVRRGPHRSEGMLPLPPFLAPAVRGGPRRRSMCFRTSFFGVLQKGVPQKGVPQKGVPQKCVPHQRGCHRVARRGCRRRGCYREGVLS